MDLKKEIFQVTALTIGILSIWKIGDVLISNLKNQIRQKSKNKRNNLGSKSQRWLLAGKVKKLIIYPVKSCNGIEVESAKATKIGLQAIGEDANFVRDRIFLVVNERYVFQSQRVHPTLVHINVNIKGSEITLSSKNCKSITFKVPENIPANLRSCRVWDDPISEVVDCGDAVAVWLDNYLDVKGYRLVFHAKNITQRTLTPLQASFPMFENRDKGSFQDQASYLLLTESSINDLNQNLKDSVSHKNFRPNILLESTPEPYSENSWNYLRIGKSKGSTILKVAAPCTRCKLTTIDPVTAKFHPDGEPLKTLVERPCKFEDDEIAELVKGEGVIGLRLGLFTEGHPINIGDPIYVAIL